MSEKKKKEGRFSKLILGMVVGGAVGSVVGVTLSDKERRKKIKEKSLNVFHSGKDMFEKYTKKQAKKSEEKKSIWHVLNRFFHGDKK